ncbi:MAG: ATP-binding protein [Deltaproteobacteria bacterium]|nr:ATP-binding protein [Deltaproteobacteria bacterium]
MAEPGAYVARALDLPRLAARKSLFLLGPRQTGKSALVRHALPRAKVYDLLDPEVFLALGQRPGRLGEELAAQDRLVVIDEIQKLPILLDEVHRLIEQRGVRFVLTGSSARKLRRGGVNLLGGRAATRTLHPFIARELGDAFDLDRALDRGLIPSIYFSDDPDDDLRAYVGTYLKEEIAAEAATRNIPAFARFLEVAALCNGTMLNFSQVASDAQVPLSTVREYFHILEDTLVGRLLPAWTRTRKRKAISTAKHYFFDIGVARHLQHRSRLSRRSPEFGEAFEGWVFHELCSYLDYAGGAAELAYWRSTSNFEVDFVLGGATAIEVKAKDPVGDRDLRGLRALREESLLKQHVVVCLEPRPRTVDGIQLIPWREFLDGLWGGAFS